MVTTFFNCSHSFDPKAALSSSALLPFEPMTLPRQADKEKKRKQTNDTTIR
jgi:hypothetical protein